MRDDVLLLSNSVRSQIRSIRAANFVFTCEVTRDLPSCGRKRRLITDTFEMHLGGRPCGNLTVVNAQYVWKSLRIKQAGTLFQTLAFYGGCKILRAKSFAYISAGMKIEIKAKILIRLYRYKIFFLICAHFENPSFRESFGASSFHYATKFRA